jgi:hypothetical protein
MFRFFSTSSASSRRSANFRSLKQTTRIKHDKPSGAPILSVTVQYLDWAALKQQVTNTANLCFALATMEDMDMEDDLLWSKYGNLHFVNGAGKHLLQVTNTSAPPDLFAVINVDTLVAPPTFTYILSDVLDTLIVSVSAVVVFALYIRYK